MNDDLVQLVTNAKRNLDAFWPLVDALRLAVSRDPFLLLTFARSPSKIERKAAAAACGGQSDPTIVTALVNLAVDPEIEVRQELGYNLKNWPNWSEMDGAVEKLLTDFDINIRQNAAWAAQRRAALLPKLLRRLHEEQDLWVRSEIGHILGGCPAWAALPELLTRLSQDSDPGVQQACVGSIEGHLNALGGYPTDLAKPSAKTLHEVRQKVNALTYGAYPMLKNWLGAQLAEYVDFDSLAEFGSVLTLEA